MLPDNLGNLRGDIELSITEIGFVTSEIKSLVLSCPNFQGRLAEIAAHLDRTSQILKMIPNALP